MKLSFHFQNVGVVAQLVERDVRIVEVRGSTPLGSTSLSSNFCFSVQRMMPEWEDRGAGSAELC